ncbi:oligomeric Golgi complex subunit 7 [Phakopsora pachyrhizi]|nr:oligomeric Golgi complex subunit 7 [Phakopsora pachyrhizi]
MGTRGNPQSSENQDSPNLSALDKYDTVFDWLDETLLNGSTAEDGFSKSGQDQPGLSFLEKKLLKLLSVLEVAITDTSFSVDKSIDDIERNVPRLTLDLQLMRENALLLRYSLERIGSSSQMPSSKSISNNEDSQTSISQTEAGAQTDELLSRLKTLDLIKTRMESARTVLREAEAWSNLESEATGYLTDIVPSHLKAAERLAEAAKSMVVFQHTPEYESRRSLMRSLQNELEASLSTSLVKALGEKDVKRCKEYFEIFRMIEREGEFKNYYFGSRRSSISTLWSQATLSPPNVHSDKTVISGGQTFLKFLASCFYPDLRKLLQTELDFLPFIFNNPADTLTTFLTKTIDQLQPSISNRLVELVDSSYVLDYWPSLIACWNVTERFALEVQNLIYQLDLRLNEAGPLSSSSSSKVARRTSLKRPIARATGSQSGIDLLRAEESLAQSTPQVPEQIGTWETSLFEPFIDLQCNYHEHEHNFLEASMLRASKSAEASTLGRTDQNVTMTANTVMPEVMKSLLKLANESIDRCEAFTHGYGILSCFEAIDLMFSKYLESRAQLLFSEREDREGEKYNSSFQRSHNAQGKGAHSYISDATEPGALELEGLDYSPEDWEIFQQGLKLLSACKVITDRLLAYEKETRSRALELVMNLRGNSNRTVALDENLELTRIRLSKGARVLLKESNLNNSELWRFFDIILPENRRGSSSLVSTVGAENLSSKTANKAHSSAQTHVFFPKTKSAYSKLIRESQNVVQSIVLSPLLNRVNDYPRLQTWNLSEKESQKINSMSTVDLKILNQFSKSPTELILKVGEGLFNLPRLFEIYTAVEEDALSFSIENLPFIDEQFFLDNVKSFQADNENQSAGQEGSMEHQQNVKLSSEVVISTWLSSLTSTVINQFTESTIPTLISRHRMSSHMRMQLIVDIDYLSNVVKALDVDTEALEQLKERLENLT